MLLFSDKLYHGAGANTSTRTRLGVVIDYQQPWLRPCEAHTLSADPAHVRRLPRRLQELLGYNQPSPYLGFINGQHPRQWLTEDHQTRQAPRDPLATVIHAAWPTRPRPARVRWSSPAGWHSC